MLQNVCEGQNLTAQLQPLTCEGQTKCLFFFLPLFSLTNSCLSLPGHVWLLFPLTTNWPLLANWFPPHNQLLSPFSISQPTCLIAHYGQVTFSFTTNGPVTFPHTTNYLLFPSLFPPSQQLPVITVATAKWPLLPSQLHAAVTFPPHNQLPIVSQSLSPLTTNCLSLPLQQPNGYCCPASFMPADNWAIGMVILLGCLTGRG